MKDVFSTLNSVNVNDHTEARNGLTYLSWAWAWAELKKHYPLSTYTVYENKDGWNYFTDGRTGWVKTGVTVNTGKEVLEHIEYLPIMDFRNKSIPADNITSFDVNKTIQRSLTKAISRFGLGLYIYAGEDLPEQDKEVKEEKKPAPKKEAKDTDLATQDMRNAITLAFAEIGKPLAEDAVNKMTIKQFKSWMQKAEQIRLEKMKNESENDKRK